MVSPNVTWSARWWILALGAVALLAVYGLTLRTSAVGLYHDDGIYAVNAKALAEGHGYRIISLPDEIPQTKYPILFPLGLSLIWRAVPSFPDNVLYLKLWPFAAALVWLWLVDRFLAYHTGRADLARGIAVLTAASPWVLFYTTALFSEALFAVFAWGGLWMLTRCERESATTSRLLLAALLCGAAYNTRTAGFTLIAAGILGLAIKKEFRAAAVFGALSGALALPWILWSSSQAETVPEFYSYYTGSSYWHWNVLFDFTLSEKFDIIERNAIYLLVGPGQLMGFNFVILWPLLFLIGVLTAVGFLASARQGIRVVHLFVGGYVATLLLWSWPPARFLLPIYPLFLLFAVLGGQQVLVRWSLPRMRTAATVAVVVAVAFASGWGSGTVAYYAATKQRACLYEPCGRSWQDYPSVMSWMEGRTPAGAILMGTQDPMLYLYTGRKAVRAFEQDPFLLHYANDPDRQPFGSPEALANRIRESGAEYLVLAHREESLTDAFLWRQYLDLRRARPALFEPEMTVGSPDFGVYRINRKVLSSR
jgi:hypothetical protein